MMTTPAQPPKVYAALDPPPQDARFGDLLQLLLDKGVRAPRSGKVGRPWQFEEFAGHVPPLTSRQLRNIRNHRSLPHDRHFTLMLEVLFGTDPSDYAEWRADLSNALHRGRAGRKLARKRSTINVPAQATNIASQSFVPPGTTPARVPLHFHAREDDLAELHRNLIKPPHRLALHGAHGVGKTVVAAAYAELTDTSIVPLHGSTPKQSMGALPVSSHSGREWDGQILLWRTTQIYSRRCSD